MTNIETIIDTMRNIREFAATIEEKYKQALNRKNSEEWRLYMEEWDSPFEDWEGALDGFISDYNKILKDGIEELRSGFDEFINAPIDSII